MMGALEFAIAAMQLIKGGAEAITVADQALTAISQPGGPTQADWDALHATEAALRIRLMADPAAPS